jgi:hypothetical protein
MPLQIQRLAAIGSMNICYELPRRLRRVVLPQPGAISRQHSSTVLI